MAKRSSSKKKKRAGIRAALADRLADINPLDRIPHAPTVLSVAALTVLALTWWIGVPRLQSRVAATNRVDPETLRLTYGAVPDWVPDELLVRLERTARHELTGDPLAQRELVSVRDALLASGWFESITQVTRVRLDEVRVEGTFVTRFAAIRDDEGDHVVDAAGRLLPLSYPPDYPHDLIVIENVSAPRPDRPGRAWAGRDVADALSLVSALGSKPWFRQVRSIDASEANRDTLAIVTDIGAQIIWGSVPGRERPMEMAATTKLAYLDRAYYDSGTGRIDWNQKGRWHFLADTLARGES